MTAPQPARPNHYEVLGIDPRVGAAAVRAAYVAQARRHHPDVAGGDAARMRAINEAWAVLGDPRRRAAYDAALAAGDAPRPAPTGPDGPLPVTPDTDIDLDEVPVHPTARMPRWLSLAPVALFAVSVGTFVVALVMSSQQVLGLSVVAFVLSCLLFLASPFVALFASRRAESRQ